jgi:hypothetical protein
LTVQMSITKISDWACDYLSWGGELVPDTVGKTKRTVAGSCVILTSVCDASAAATA